MAGRSLDELADYVEAARADADPVPYQILDDEYGLWLRGEYDSLEKLKKQSIKKLMAEQAKLSKSKKMTSWVVSKGGLNKESFAAEGVDPASFKRGFPRGFWRANGGMTADDLAEALLDDPSIYSGAMADFDSPIRFGANDALEWAFALIDNPQMYRDPTVQLRIDDLDDAIRQVEAAPRWRSARAGLSRCCRSPHD